METMRGLPRRILLPAIAAAALGAELPQPSGPYGVGRITDAVPGDEPFRIHLWYPAEATPAAGPALYVPAAARISSESAWAALFGPAWPAIRAGALRATARADARISAARGRWPVLIFSHGGGMTPFAYTAQLEELASHGFVMVAIEHAADALDNGLSPAFTAQAVQTARRIADGPAAERDRRAAEVRAGDVVQLLDRLHAAGFPLGAHLDTQRIGIFGHSIGGRTAALACQTDQRLCVCVNQDGAMRWHPFRPPAVPAREPVMRQPFLMIDQYQPDLPEDAYVKMGTNREAYASARAARQQEARQKLYGKIAGGSQHVTLRTPGVSHNSFADVRLLGRLDGPGINLWPAELRSGAPHRAILAEITAWTRAFFDQHLNGAVCGSLPATPETAVELFPPFR